MGLNFTQKIMPCGCLNKYQDKKYGEGNRVFNERGGKNKGKYRCTSCGSERS